MNTSTKTALEWVLYLGLILVAIGCLLTLIMGPRTELYKYVFSAGAVLHLIGRIALPYRGPYLRVKRLSRILVWSGLFYCAGAFFMFYTTNPQDWLAFVLAGAVIQCYVSIVMPRAIRKSEQERTGK